MHSDFIKLNDQPEHIRFASLNTHTRSQSRTPHYLCNEYKSIWFMCNRRRFVALSSAGSSLKIEKAHISDIDPDQRLWAYVHITQNHFGRHDNKADIARKETTISGRRLLHSIFLCLCLHFLCGSRNPRRILSLDTNHRQITVSTWVHSIKYNELVHSVFHIPNLRVWLCSTHSPRGIGWAPL